MRRCEKNFVKMADKQRENQLGRRSLAGDGDEEKILCVPTYVDHWL